MMDVLGALGSCFEWLGLFERQVSVKESCAYISDQFESWDSSNPTTDVPMDYNKVEEFAQPFIGKFLPQNTFVYDKKTRAHFNFDKKYKYIYSLAGLSYVNPKEFAETWKKLVDSLEDGGILIVTFPYDSYKLYDKVRKEATKTWHVKNRSHVVTLLRDVEILYCDYGNPSNRAKEIQCVVKRIIPGHQPDYQKVQ